VRYGAPATRAGMDMLLHEREPFRACRGSLRDTCTTRRQASAGQSRMLGVRARRLPSL
jgi:hypothetical protein